MLGTFTYTISFHHENSGVEYDYPYVTDSEGERTQTDEVE